MDHVAQSTPPDDAVGEWFEDPDGYFGKIPIGPGMYRLPGGDRRQPLHHQ